MESISSGGLVSGLDTNSIIDGLSSLEQLKVDRIEAKQTALQEKKDDPFKNFCTQVTNVVVKKDKKLDYKIKKLSIICSYSYIIL